MVSISIDLDRSSKAPLQRQLYDSLRAAILTARLAPGDQLPPTRELAEQLGISRTTVVIAYERLITEGFLEARVGSATCVAHFLPQDPVLAPGADRYGGDATPEVSQADPTGWPGLNDAASAGTTLPYRFHHPVMGAVDVFPLDEWRRLVAETWRTATPLSLVDCPPAGDVTLRREVVRYVRANRGIKCDASQVIITSSNQQAVDLLCKVLVRRHDRVAIEDPTRPGLPDVFRAYNADLVPVPVDEDGLIAAALRRLGGRAPRLVCVTPTHHYPTGAVLSPARRLELLAWAAEHRVLLLEDANDSELTYQGAVHEALQAIDTAGIVAHIGTFTRVLNPSIQIGYLILPAGLVSAVLAAHRLVARSTDIVHQKVLAAFIRRGGLARHLRRLRRVHMARRDALVAALRDEFGDEVVIGPARAGTDIQVRWPNHPITDDVVRRARAEGVGLLAVRSMYIVPPKYDPGVSMAYGSLDEQAIRRGVTLLAEVLRTPPGDDGSHWYDEECH